MLGRFDLASGTYRDDGDDDIRLHGTRITNVVRCLPPENKPVAAEVNACRAFPVSYTHLTLPTILLV